MYIGYQKIFWGLFFSTFHINLGPIQILPAFLGWLFVADGIIMLYNESSYPSYKKAYNFTLAVVGFSFIGFIASLSGDRYHITNYTSLAVPLIEFFLIYYLLVASIEYTRDTKGEEAAGSYKNDLPFYMIIYIINTITGMIAYTIEKHGLLTISALVGIFQILWLMRIVSDLKLMQKKPPIEN